MCLSKLKNFRVKLDENGIGEGWKIFEDRKNGELHGDYFSKGARPQGKWLDEKDFCLCPWDRGGEGEFLNAGKQQYRYGWHIFLRKRDAESWLNGESNKGNILKRVKFKNILAKGNWISYKKIIVAKEIFIPK